MTEQRELADRIKALPAYTGRDLRSRLHRVDLGEAAATSDKSVILIGAENRDILVAALLACDEIESLTDRLSFAEFEWHRATDGMKERDAEIERLRNQLFKAREALEALVNAKALAGVRPLVAGWNGEGRKDGPYQRHPDRLGSRIDTNCGDVYALDEAIQRARAALTDDQGEK